MFVATLLRSAARKALSLGLIALLATGQLRAADHAAKFQSSVPPLTPMPQAPAPQHNAHLYSDQNYAKRCQASPI